MAIETTTLEPAAKAAIEARGSGEDRFMIPGLPIDPSEYHEAQAPLIRNAWYVIAARSEVDRTLRSIRALGEPLVYYRTEAGDAVVLDDRCAHRRFPLSKSKLVGDAIQCGYHGFKYGANGRCLWAPGVDVQPKFGVRAYPSVELGPWLWVWMGDPAKADLTPIPYEELEGDHYHSITGYKLNPGNYMIMIENLLDLTHIHYLHGEDAASLETAIAPPKALEVANGVGWSKLIENDVVGAMAHWCGGEPTQAARSEQFIYQHGPAVHVAVQSRTPLPGDDRPMLPSYFRVVHALTPIDDTSTHQFYMISVNQPLAMPVETLKGIVEGVVFEQDVEAIGYLQEAILSDQRAGNREFGIFSDRFGITMRKKMRDLKAQEL